MCVMLKIQRSKFPIDYLHGAENKARYQVSADTDMSSRVPIILTLVLLAIVLVSRRQWRLWDTC
jgi:hypothetical protein